ncbi:MAG: hypothetical protein EBU49_13355, partial [Proteobacteria bacterium]|nr:hypothetical protein [Pseudomonadota bacterium]
GLGLGLGLGLSTLWDFQTFAATSLQCPDGANHLCLYSPVDPAGSKGSQSLALGFGIASAPNSTPSRDSEAGIETYPQQLFRAHVTKGLSVPVDIGFMLGTTETGQFQQAGIHGQWTPFEGFKLPAVTVRGSILRSFWSHPTQLGDKIEMASIESKSLDLLCSWGLLGVLTPYAGVGWATVDDDFSMQNFTGIEIQAAPPFMRIGIESRIAFSKRSVLAKVSLGL